jgi:tripartite-type tricarboxylate transporter receptor subunit TctC
LDITPISVLGSSPFLFVVNPAKVSARTAPELQALLKSKPGILNYASSGNGTIIHLAGEMVVDALGAQVRHVPYKGVGQQITDTIAGHVEMGVVAAPAVMAHIKSGALHAIGVTGHDRAASIPDLKTFAEQGFKDINISGWFAAIGPAGMPQDQVKRIHEALQVAFKDPEVSAAMARQGNTVQPGTPIEALMFMRSEQARLTVLAKKADIQLD